MSTRPAGVHTIWRSVPGPRPLLAGLAPHDPIGDDDRMAEGVYDRIKARLTARTPPPGQLLQIGVLAEELGVSTTPVREALTRLAAERVIVLVPKKGFFTKIPAEDEIRGLYCVNLTLLEAALAERPPTAALGELGSPDVLETRAEAACSSSDAATDRSCRLVRRTARLFVHIAARAAIGEYVDIVSNANDRLHQARLIECDLVPNVDEELARLEALHAASRIDELKDAVRRYHALRLERLPSICKELLFRPFSSVQR